MRYINGKSFTIGTGSGQYPEGTKLTDSFIGVVPDNVSFICINTQVYNNGFNCTGDCIDFSGVGTSTSNGDVLTVNFKEGIQIGN